MEDTIIKPKYEIALKVTKPDVKTKRRETYGEVKIRANSKEEMKEALSEAMAELANNLT